MTAARPQFDVDVFARDYASTCTSDARTATQLERLA